MNPLQVFQFHDIAAVEVQSDSPFVRSFFDAEYGYHRVEKVSNGTPLAFLDFRLDSSPPNGYARNVHKLFARWGYQLTINPGEIDINVFGNKPSVSMVHHMLVHPSLRWLAAGGGTLLLHAGAVVKNGKSLILTGKGGVGKTTTTSLILASGGRPGEMTPQNKWQIHADDYVFLDGGQSKAYVTRSHLYSNLIKWIPEIGDRLTPWERIWLMFFGAVRKYSGENIKWAVRLSPKRLWPGIPIADTAIPAAILLLDRTDASTPKLVPVGQLHMAVNDLLEMNFGEAQHFLRLLQKNKMLDIQWLEAWKDTERNLLIKLLAETPIYRLMVPFSQSSQEVKATLLPLLEKLTGE